MLMTIKLSIPPNLVLWF